MFIILVFSFPPYKPLETYLYPAHNIGIETPTNLLRSIYSCWKEYEVMTLMMIMTLVGQHKQKTNGLLGNNIIIIGK